jgi:hypothetical protein
MSIGMAAFESIDRRSDIIALGRLALLESALSRGGGWQWIFRAEFVVSPRLEAG